MAIRSRIVVLVALSAMTVSLVALLGREPGGATSGCSSPPDVLTHGPRVGEVTTTSAKVWVRACQQVDVSVQYKLSSADWSTAQETATVAVDPAADYTAVVALGGLTADTTYDYRFAVGGQMPAKGFGGSFATAPDPGGSQVTFAVATDMHHPYEPLPDAILGALAKRNPDLSFWLGDHMVIEIAIDQLYGYCCIPQSQAHYEGAYEWMFTYPPFASFIANNPALFSWDDHEIANDWDQGSALPYPYARAAFDEFLGSANPAPRVPDTLYYTQRWGDIEFYVLDTRSYRSLGEMPDGPEKTMLGAEQKADLKDWLLNSDARFKFIVSSVMWTDFSGHTIFGESWPAFATERNEIFDFIEDNHIAGVMLFSGDEHWAGVFRMNPWGIYEVAPGPLGWKVGGPNPPANPQVLFKLGWTRVFGLFDVDTTVCPARLTVRLVDQDNQTRYSLPLTEMEMGADPDLDGLPPCQEQQLGTDPNNADSDGDGCNDNKEIGLVAGQGGQRDPANPWDYFNPSGDGLNRADDIVRVVRQYFIDEGEPGYTSGTDRTFVGPKPWNLGPPDGQQRAADVLHVVRQYFHDC